MSTPTLAWDATVILERYTAMRGTNTSVSMIITNTWLRDIRINSVNLTIDWPGGPNNLSASGTPKGIGSGGSASFLWHVEVPNTLNKGDVFHAGIDVNVTESTEQHEWANVSSSKNWVFDITITTQIIVDGNDGGPTTTLLGLPITWMVILLVILLTIAVIVLLVGAARRSQRRNE